MVLPVIFWFSKTTIRDKVSKFAAAYFWLCVALAIPVFFLKQEPLLYIFMAASVPAAGYLVIMDFARPMIKFGRSNATGAGGARAVARPAGGSFRVHEDAPRPAAARGDLPDGLRVRRFRRGQFRRPSHLFELQGVSVLVLGTAGILASDFMSMYSEARELNVSLERKVEERSARLGGGDREPEAAQRGVHDR